MSNAGSYNVSSMNSKEAELLRLRTQAEKLYPLESKLLKDWGGLKTHHRVLEVGSGPGFLTPLLCELASEGQVTACDTSEELIEICKQQKVKTPKNGFQALHSKSSQIPVSDNSHDFSYLRFVLQHTPDRIHLLKEVKRVLSPGGTICVLDSEDGLTLQYPEDRFVTELISDAQKIQAEKGGDRFIGRKVGSYLKEAGYQKIKSRVLNFTSLDMPFSILAGISLGFKSELCGKKNELGQWIREKEKLSLDGQYFFTVGVVLTTAEKGE